MSNSQPLKVEPFFGGFVLETLTVGMYGESRNAIREYIQNGFDSIQKATKIGLIKASDGLIEVKMGVDKNTLVIRDNGAGISAAQAGTILTRIGASTKDPNFSAGFRGIGRLAGVGFCNTVTFLTKVKGEKQATTVLFRGDRMRELMSPSKGSEISAEQLLRLCVEGSVDDYDGVEEHFFEVTLHGFVDAPEECTNFALMEEFISQVAPVGYHESFPYKSKLEKAAADCDLPIEVIRVSLSDGDRPAVEITKGYRDIYQIEAGDIKLSDCQIYQSPGADWWAWIGKKEESGSYTDSRISGIRVRMKNIQIDGTDIIREIFKRRAKSFIRFQDWSVGEIFVRPSFLVPNARRDGFEETPAWKSMRKELTEKVIQDLGENSYEISNKGQLSLVALTEKVKEKNEDLERLRRAGFRNLDKVLEVSVAVTKLQKSIATASKNANLETLADLQALSSELVDIKSEAVGNLASKESVDPELMQLEMRDQLLKDLLRLFEDNLDPGCYISVRNLLREHYDIKG